MAVSSFVPFRFFGFWGRCEDLRCFNPASELSAPVEFGVLAGMTTDDLGHMHAMSGILARLEQNNSSH